MKFRLRVCLIVFVSGFSVSASAGQWHYGSTLKCQECHLQHASREGQPSADGPNTYLLLKGSINELCLSCHNGTDPAAPDVQAPVQMYLSTESAESAAGYFELVGTANVNGHNLDLGAVTPLQTEAQFAELNCANCHAVHGNENYRNLHYDPARNGDSIMLVEGVDLFTQYAPDNPPTISASTAAYSRDNVGYKQNYSNWCVSCHNQLSANSMASYPAHFNSHPSDVGLNDYSGETHTDAAHWTTGIGEGFLTTVGELTTGVRRVPFEAPLAVNFVEAQEPSENNEVFCGSCHKAHGGLYEKGLLWPFLQDESNFVAGCQQCHNK